MQLALSFFFIEAGGPGFEPKVGCSLHYFFSLLKTRYTTKENCEKNGKNWGKMGKKSRLKLTDEYSFQFFYNYFGIMISCKKHFFQQKKPKKYNKYLKISARRSICAT